MQVAPAAAPIIAATPAPPPLSVREIALVVFFLATFTWFCQAGYATGSSADLRAWWMASESLAAGQPLLIYPTETDVFTMRPAAEWHRRALARGEETALYPYLYPPLWVALGAPLTRAFSFAQAVHVASLLNPLLLGAMILLARRAAASPLRPAAALLLGLALTGGTLIGWPAIYENQPQILVAALVVLAIERDRSGAPLQAGAALALAAALKLYPALFVLVWLLSGRMRPVAAFVVVGGALGLGSVALAGWPLHRLFLDQLAVLSSSVMLTNINHNLDALVSQLFLLDSMQRITEMTTRPLGPEGAKGWYVLAKGPAWAAASKLAMLAAVAGFALAMRRRSPAAQAAYGWPAMMIALALVAPLSWSYHYLAPAVFAPALLVALGRRRGGLLLAAVFVPISIPMLIPVNRLLPLTSATQFTGTLAMLLLGAAFALALWRSPRLPA